MDFGTAIKTCFGKYVDFTGRAARSEFWFFHLFYWIVLIVASVIDSLVGTGTPIVTIIVILAMVLPSLAAQIRRLHDLDKSGWYWFFSFIPLIGGIILLVWFMPAPGCRRRSRATG